LRSEETTRWFLVLARKPGQPQIVAAASFSVIATLNRIGQRFKSALRALRLLTRVLFVALRGLYRSWQAQDPTARPTFHWARHAAYRQLWTMLENVYWKLRAPNTDSPTVRALLSDVNELFLQSVLYVQPADQAVISQYILSLQRLRATSCLVKENEAAEAWEANRLPAPGSFANIDLVTAEVIELRNRVLQKMRRALPTA